MSQNLIGFVSQVGDIFVSFKFVSYLGACSKSVTIVGGVLNSFVVCGQGIRCLNSLGNWWLCPSCKNSFLGLYPINDISGFF